MGSSKGEVTRILGDLNQGDGSAMERLLPLVYDELRALAGSYFARQQAGHTLQPTALVHEAYLKLVGGEGRWQNRAHFMAVAAKAMRQILMNHARDKAAVKRGGGAAKLTIIEAVTSATDESDAGRQLDLIALDEALTKLAAVSERQAWITELRFFGGLTIADTAHVVGVSTTTVEDDWHMARAWLGRELQAAEP